MSSLSFANNDAEIKQMAEELGVEAKPESIEDLSIIMYSIARFVTSKPPYKETFDFAVKTLESEKVKEDTISKAKVLISKNNTILS